MKLVDILARELGEWPDGSAALVQEANGRIHGCVREDLYFDPEKELRNSAWLSQSSSWWSISGTSNHPLFNCPGRILELSDDFRTAIVTRAQWQAAVEALNAEQPKLAVNGLPPVGTKCMLAEPIGNSFLKQFRGLELEVVMHDVSLDGHQIAVFRCLDPEELSEVEEGEEISGVSYLYHGVVAKMLKPIRTPRADRGGRAGEGSAGNG